MKAAHKAQWLCGNKWIFRAALTLSVICRSLLANVWHNRSRTCCGLGRGAWTTTPTIFVTMVTYPLQPPYLSRCGFHVLGVPYKKLHAGLFSAADTLTLFLNCVCSIYFQLQPILYIRERIPPTFIVCVWLRYILF